MAHELSEVNGVTEFFYHGTKPWHGLGTPVNDLATAKEAIEAAHLDWIVEKKDIYFKEKDTFAFTKTEGCATVRADINHPLGIVSNRYMPIQNYEAFDFMDTLVATREAKYVTAGALFQGKKVFLLCQIPGHISINQDDKVEKYLLLVNTHDGSSTLKVMFTGVRVVCNNTLKIATSKSNSFETVSIHHKGNLHAKITEAQKILGISINYFKLMEETFQKFSGYIISQQEATQYFLDVIPGETPQATRIRSKIEELYYTGQGADLAINSIWGAYNAVTEYVDHHRIDHNAKPDRYLDSTIFGRGAEIKDTAYKTALALIS